MTSLADYRDSADYQANPDLAERILTIAAGLFLRFRQRTRGDALAAGRALAFELEDRGTPHAQAQRLAGLAAAWVAEADADDLLAAADAVRNA